MVAQRGEDSLDETRSLKRLSPGTLISHYRIVVKVGEGGMGVVYKATDTRLDRTVALKFLPSDLLCDAEARSRFEHEAKAASALNHSNIATIYEIDEQDGLCFIAMEFLGERSLGHLLKARELSLKDVLDLAIQIGQGLNAAHEGDVVHRDIKPDNVMLTEKGQAKIVDFGLAKLKGASKLTKTGTTLGTLQYMSPEQASGEEVDRQSDIFSFGVILYEMITGRLPFKGDYEAAIIYSILNDMPEPLARYKADVPEGLERVVNKALAKDKDARYQHADELVTDLRRVWYAMDAGAGATRETPRKPIRRYLRIVIPVAVLCMIALLIFILEPFRVEVGPRDEAAAKENSLAVMYFENVMDPDDETKIARMIMSLLITDLSESGYMQVVSRQRLYDILKILGKEDLRVIDKTVASEVAKEAGVRLILTGDVLSTEPTIVLTSDISDARTGKILASQQITAEPGEDLFSLVDRLSAQIREDLALPAAALAEHDGSIADVTTHSAEAYRYYLEGEEFHAKLYEEEAERSFRKAIKLDSTFAMAYLMLALYTSGAENEEMMAKAVEYSEKASWKERQLIKAEEALQSMRTQGAIEIMESTIERYPDEKRAFYTLGRAYYYFLAQTEKSIPYFEKVLELDPFDKDVLNQLSYIYDEVGEFEKAIATINRYIKVAPDEANPYDTMGDLYRGRGKLDEAASYYLKALEIKPDFYPSLFNLGHMYLFKGDYAEAESWYRELASCNDEYYRAWGRTHLAYIPMYQGKFEEALAILAGGIAADRMEKYEGWAHEAKYWRRMDIYDDGLHELDLAINEVEKAIDIHRRTQPDDKTYGLLAHAVLLAKKGDFEKAEDVAATMKENTDDKVDWFMDVYWRALLGIEQVRGDYEASRAAREKMGDTDLWLSDQYLQGELCLRIGRLGEAVESFEKVLSDYSDDRAAYPIRVVKSHYLLGVAYEDSGWRDKAIDQYERFLDIWKDADSGIPEVEEARRRLARLKTGA